jgi:hypothetical protein
MSATASSDFPDRLSPILVKELRQGLRAKTFIVVFLSLQAVLALILFAASASSTSGSVGTIISGVIFIFFSIAVLVVQPLRGIGSVSSEIKSNTIDMMVLTRLTATRIVFGKWFALVSQSALLLATVIPYLIYRYVLGEMNLVGEVVLLILIFLTSMAATAVTVGLSGSSSIILRTLLPIFAIPVLAYAALMAMFVGSMGGSSMIERLALDTTESRVVVSVYIVCIGYLAWSMLSWGSSIIATAAENHATLRRLIVLVASGIAIFFITSTYVDKDFIPLIFTLVTLPAIATALTERSFVAPSVRESFTKRGLLGKITAPFLSPGWPSGVMFTFLLSAIFLFFCFRQTPSTHLSDDHQIHILGLLGGLLFPAVILILFRTDEASRVSSYLLILIGSGIFTMIIYAISESLGNDELLWFFIWNPLTFLPLSAETPIYHEHLAAVAAIVVGLEFIILATTALIAMKRQREDHRALETA